MQIKRMFRTCGPKRSLPTGTLAFVESDGGLMAVMLSDVAGSKKTTVAVRGEPTIIDPDPKADGLVSFVDAYGTSWTTAVFRELPVTADSIVGATVQIVHGAGVRT